MSGEIVHIEIPGGIDTGRARAFWSALFAWQFDEVPVPSAQYLLTRNNDQQGAALSNFEPSKRGIRPYFSVEDIDASIIRVTELRGEVYEKMALPGAGWFALCRDPHGNQFGLWQRDPQAKPPNLDPVLAEFHPGSRLGLIEAVQSAPAPTAAPHLRNRYRVKARGGMRLWTSMELARRRCPSVVPRGHEFPAYRGFRHGVRSGGPIRPPERRSDGGGVRARRITLRCPS